MTSAAHPPPWGVVFNMLADAYVATCYLCQWRGEPACSNLAAQPEMNRHLHSAEHRDAAVDIPAHWLN